MIPAASVATRVTSASPIISAAAVDAVRCGFRRALSRASARPHRRSASPASRAHARAGRTSCGAKQRDADEDQQRAEEHQEQHRRRPEPRRTGRTSSAANPRTVEHRGDRRPEAGEAARRQRRSLAHGGDRRHAGRADRRPEARDQRHDDPDERARRRSSGSRTASPLFGSVNPTASKSLNSPFASASPRNSPTIEATIAHDERLDDAPRRAPGAATRRASAASRTRACAARS